MSYWEHFQSAAGIFGAYHWVLLGCILAALGLRALVPAARHRLRGAVVLILLSLPGFLFCGLMSLRGVEEEAALYRWTHFLSHFVLALGIINLFSVLIFRVVLQAIRVQLPPILRDTILGLAYIIAAIMLLSRHGVNLSGIIATSAVITAVIGFSLQDTLGNIMGGVALQMERSIAVGDWVKVGDVEGLVREIRWRQTSIETRNWDTVVIPNSQLMKLQVTVLGRREGKPKFHRMWVYFQVDYRYSPPDVIEAVQGALAGEQIPNVATDPAPDCLLHEFKESYASYAVRYWLTDMAKDSPTSSEIRTRIFIALQRAGMRLSIPAQSVFLTMEGRKRTEGKMKREVGQRVPILRRAAILNPLTDDEIAELAGKITVAPFRRGEIMTRQGNIAHYLYILTRGDAKVRVELPTGESKEVATLHPGHVFGEMSLMTGEPRSATVVALTDAICYRLDKDAFGEILRHRPPIAEAIAKLMAERKVELDAVKEGLSAEAARSRVAPATDDLLRRIRKFFSLA